MRHETWECIVWDGTAWQRFPDCVFMTPESALDAAGRIPAPAVNVVTTRDLDERGLPVRPPAGLQC